MKNSCSINFIENAFVKSLVSESRVKETLLSLLDLGANVLDILNVVSAPLPSRVKRTLNPKVLAFIQDITKVTDFLQSPKVIEEPEKPAELKEGLDEIVQKTKRSRTWITKAWGLASLSLDKFILNFSRDINSRILGVIKQSSKTENPEEALNIAIQQYFNYNLKSLQEYFILNGRSDLATFISDNMPFEGTYPNERIKKIIEAVSPYFEDMTDADKMAYTNPKSSRYQLAKAYATFLMISPLNFDNFIKSTINSIRFKNGGKLTNDINKYSIVLGHGKGITSWISENALYKLSSMVDDIIQLEMSNWPLYRRLNGVWIKQEDEWCRPEVLVGALTKVFNIANLKGDPNTFLFMPIEESGLTSNLIDDLKSTFRESFGFNSEEDIIEKIFREQIEGKTIPEIIANIPSDPYHMLPISLWLLLTDTSALSYKNILEEQLNTSNKDFITFNENEINVLYALWENMFNPKNNNSLFNLINPNSPFDLYQMITLVLTTHEKKDLYGIINENGEVSKKYYSTGKANLRLNYLLSKLNGFYSPLINRNIYNTKIESDFENATTAITFTPPFKFNTTYTITISNKGTDIVLTKNGTKYTSSEAKSILDDLKVLFSETLLLDFEGDLIEIYLNKSGNSYNKALLNLLKIVGNLIYASEVSKHLAGLSTNAFKNNLLNFYLSAPKLVRGVTYNQVDAFSNIFPLIQLLSLANDIHDGIIGDIVVKGGAGELINSVILSALTTKFMPFFAEKAKPQNSAIKDFSIKDVYKRTTFLRDYVDNTKEVKSATGMNVEEFFINSFIDDFYGNLLAIHLGVLSDKPNIVKFELYKNMRVEVEPGVTKELKDCTAQDLKKIAVRELGVYYSLMKSEIDRNLSILNKYSVLANGRNLYNINDDYALTRDYDKKTLEEDVHNAIYAAQQAGEDIEINELLYFSWDGNTLHTKPSLISELAKHDVDVNTFGLKVENSTEFFQRKEAELVANILQDLRSGISFIDSKTGKVIDSFAVKEMLKANKNGWSTKRNIIVAKIHYGDLTKDLITKSSLTNWAVYRNLHKYLKESGNTNYDISKLDLNEDFDFKYFLNTVLELLSDIREYNHLQKVRQQIKSAVRKALNTSTSEINKDTLVKSYRQYRIDNFQDTLAELDNAVREYSLESDNRIWRLRNTAYLMENFDKLSYEEVLNYNDEFNLGINTSLEESPKVDFSLEVNPELQRYNTLNYLYSEEGLNSTVGSHINHKAKYTTNLTLLGAIETGQLAKRNVAESGSKNLYVRGDIQGVGLNMKIAVVKDTKASISTINGVDNPTGATVMDGATFGNYVTRKEELYSLGSLKAGIENSKPLGNDLNLRTGTGTIIKTAVFALTNGRIRSSNMNIIIHKHMNNIPWDSRFDGNFLEDYNHQKIKYLPVIVYKPSTGNYYLRNNILIGQDGIASFDEVQLTKEILDIKIGKLTLGSLISRGVDITPYYELIRNLGNSIDTVFLTRKINTNYELWDLFGGAYSASILEDNELSYYADNTSLENLTLAAHNCGIKLNTTPRPTEADVFLPLKLAKIDYIVTEGAIKLGAANINSTTMLTDESYPVTTRLMSTADIGMQLNPEHLVDDSQLSLMTQVVNALGLRGYSADAGNRVYTALSNLTDFNLQELFKGIEANLNGDNGRLKNAMSSLLLKAILGTSETDGDLLSAITLQLNENERNGQDYEIIKHKLPISDPSVLNKIVSNFASIMTKAGVRIKFPGSMNVLVPSDGIYRIYNGRLRQFADTSRTNRLIPNNEAEIERQKLLKLLEDQPEIKLHLITFGASYYVKLRLGEFDSSNPLTQNILLNKSIKVDDLKSYYLLRKLLLGKDYTLIEDITKGRDLAPYNCVFNTDKGTFMLWDLDSIRHSYLLDNDPEFLLEVEQYTDDEIIEKLHINPDLLDKSNLKSSLLKLINRRKQIELNSIGSGYSNSVYILGERVIIDKSSIKVKPYELIAPKNYATTFGLKAGDRLDLIAKDLYYFLRKLIQFYKQSPVSSSNYDIILKTISGKSYPILYNDGKVSIPSDLKPISRQEFYDNLDWDGGKVYRLDENGNRLYEIPYELDANNKVVYKAQILLDSLGNEVIFTDDLNHFLNTIKFNNIDFGNHIFAVPTLLALLINFGISKKPAIRRLAQDFNRSTEIEIKAAINEWFELRDSQIETLEKAIENKTVNINDYTGIIYQMVKSAIESHTSFLKSLEYIVSRTPALSFQSFMPMVLVDFDDALVNSAYVNRMLLYLQGSDFDVDKASLLGSLFNNGKYITWSSLMDLSSIEHLRASETLPFPTGKKLSIVSSLNSRIYDVIDRPINILWEDNITFTLPNKLGKIVLENTENGYRLFVTEELSPYETYILERAVVDKLKDGDILTTNLSNVEKLGLVKLNDGSYKKDSSKYDYRKDLELFDEIFKDVIEKASQNYYLTPSEIRLLGIAINAYNAFGYTLNKTIKKVIDGHNLYFEGKGSPDPKSAVINYISSQMFLISSDPVNLILGMTSVDLLTETIKDLANSKSKLAKLSLHFDKGNIMAIFRLLRLTLSGKQNTGIEASSLKVMEAINLYQDIVLNYGTDEEQKSLLKPIEIAGDDIQLICNAYAKNIANIKSKEVYDALLFINNDEDLALWLSAMLSLSTDNAKDPTLAKINANPEMIGLYNAGFVLGVPIEVLISTILSPTGLAIANLQSGNVFLGSKGMRDVNAALRFIKRGPILSMNPITQLILQKAINLYYPNAVINNSAKPLIPNIYDSGDLVIARRILSIVKELAYGEGEINYGLPSITTRVNNELQWSQKSLRQKEKILEQVSRIRDLKASEGKGHKREDTRIEKLVGEISDLRNNIELLLDISRELRITESIPWKAGNKYIEYIQYEKLLKAILLGELSGALKAIQSYKDTIGDSRNLLKTINDLETWIDTLETINDDEAIIDLDGNKHSKLRVILQLSYMAHEMSLLRPILGLNQQLSNSKEFLLSFVSKFENIIQDRLNIAGLEETPEIKALPDTKISLVDFIWDEDYRKSVIKAYESIKYKVNVLDCIVKVPHYFGYLKTLAALYLGLSTMSLQYRELDRIAKYIIKEDLKVHSTLEILKRLKLASRYISRKINSIFLNGLNIEIYIPKIVDGVADPNVKVPIRLGTVEGNTAFKDWMDIVVIPLYKLILGNNRFFKELSQVPYHKADGHNTIINYTTGIDIMSSNPTEKTKVAEVTEAFNSLLGKMIDGQMPMIDAFFYYDLIAYDRLPGQLALTPIFNKLVGLGNNRVIQEYILFISDLDLSGNYILTMDEQTIDEIERFIAPTVSIYSLEDTNEKYVWVMDPEDLKYYLLKKVSTKASQDPSFIDDLIEVPQVDEDLLNVEGTITGNSLNSILSNLNGKYIIITEGTANPYMEGFEIGSLLIVLEGQGVLTSDELILGKEYARIENSELIFSKGFKDKLLKITGINNVDELVTTKSIIEGVSPRIVIDVEVTKGNLENPCK